jgi:hypothetical protein
MPQAVGAFFVGELIEHFRNTFLGPQQYFRSSLSFSSFSSFPSYSFLACFRIELALLATYFLT